MLKMHEINQTEIVIQKAFLLTTSENVCYKTVVSRVSAVADPGSAQVTDKVSFGTM